MSLLRLIFIWWHGATLGTLVKTWVTGTPIGVDEFGNRYYRDRKGRRWVLYNGTVEASRVPCEWHGWLHRTFENPPTVEPMKRKLWEKEHRPNLTGTAMAYRPDGSLASGGRRAPATGDYEAWRPE